MVFRFRLEHEDGMPADPPTFSAARPDWNVGDSIYLPGRTLRVLDARIDENPDGDPVSVLVVEPV
jgi:hypothetical protein